LTLSDLIDPQVLRALATRQVDSILDEADELKERMTRLQPLAHVLMQTTFEKFEDQELMTTAMTASLTTLALIDACIEDFYGKTEPAKPKARKKVGRHVN